MRPPICGICDQNCSDDGDLVIFAKRPSDLEWDREVEAGLVGHPPYAEWFCAEHLAQAQSLKHLPITEAMAKMKQS